MSFPGNLSRFEPASGLLVRSIKINGHYLFVDSCEINPEQEIDLEFLIQGGPGAAIANIGVKKISGRITCPIRVNRSGVVNNAVKALLQHAESPMSAIRIDTNHVLSQVGLTADNGGTDNNQLLSLDTVVVSDLTITATPDGGVQLTAQILGMVDARDPSDYVAPSPGQLLGRELSWGDCNVKRLESQMRSATSLEINIKNELKPLNFIPPITTEINDLSDQIDMIGIQSCKWGGKFEEILRLGVDMESHIHGGWMQNENLNIDFGPISATLSCPLFKIAEVPLSSKQIRRTTSFFGQIQPTLPLATGGLFTFSE
jgi:hypothetical protein